MSAVVYEFRALDRAGKERRGVMSAGDQQEAYRRVAAQGLTPVAIRRSRAGAGGASGTRRRRISAQRVAGLSYELSVLLRASIPIGDGLRSIAEQEPDRRLRAMITEIASSIQAGSSITDALEPHRRVFGDVFVETVRAAEHSGTLIRSLEHLAEMLERQAESGKQLKQALTYPALILIALGSASGFLIAVVVPKFASMYEARGIDLPFLTQLLAAVGLSVQHWWFAQLACAGLGVYALRRMWRSPRFAAPLDVFFHRVPYLRRVLIGLATARFARVLGISLGAGLPLIDSLQMSGRSTGRPLLIRDTEAMAVQVRLGGRLGGALESCAYLPPFAKRMIIAGEEAAELTRLCAVVAGHYERETAHLTKNVATVIEPALIALLTGLVLVVALAIFLPMWDMVSLVG